MSVRTARVLVVHPEPLGSLLESLLTVSEQVLLLVPAAPGTALGTAPAPPGLADRVEIRSFTDEQDAVRLAGELHAAQRIDAAFAVWEGAVETAAAICAALDLPGASVAAARASRDKAVAAARFAAAGVPVPHGWTKDAADPAGCAAVFRDVPDGRFVVKMPRSTNSQSVMLVRSPAELAAAMAVIRRLYRADRARNRLAVLYRPAQAAGEGEAPVLVQEFVEGPEINIDLLLDGRAHTVLGIFEKHPSVGPTFGELHSVHPTSLRPDQRAEAVQVAVDAARALGATRGAAHAELRIGPRGPVVIEVALRPGGFLTPLAVSRLTSVDVVAALARLLATGELPAVAPQPAPRACLYGAVNVARSGRLVRVLGEEQARALPGVVLLDVVKEPGDELVTLPEGTDYHLAAFLLEGESRAAVESVAQRIRGLLTAELEEAVR